MLDHFTGCWVIYRLHPKWSNFWPCCLCHLAKKTVLFVCLVLSVICEIVIRMFCMNIILRHVILRKICLILWNLSFAIRTTVDISEYLNEFSSTSGENNALLNHRFALTRNYITFICVYIVCFIWGVWTISTRD